MAYVNVDINLDDIDVSELLLHLEKIAKRGMWSKEIANTFEAICSTALSDHIGKLNSRIKSLELEVDCMKHRMAKCGVPTPEESAVEIARLRTKLRQNGVPV